jgi:tetratricopeptide (TPR) repeat protein
MQFYPPGARIAGRYEVAGRPMLGGMGIVYVCLDLEDDRPVALKTFRPEYLPDRAARDRFLREGTHWVELGAHPHIVRCYEVLRTDVGNQVYLVLELVAKEQGRADASLRSWLTPGVPLPLDTALLFALQIARGMRHAVETIPGFVHRDLKPENVLVGADKLGGTNRLRVTDFGLASVLQAGGIQTSTVSETSKVSGGPDRTQLTHGVVGTPLYMAPEQWRGEAATTATDVYALGCILYEMLAGQRAVAGSSLGALQQAHCAGKRRPLPASLPAAVGTIVARCLALAPGERYKSWPQLEQALIGLYSTTTRRPAPKIEPSASLDRAERVATGWSYNAMGGAYLDIGKGKAALGYFQRARKVGRMEEEQPLQSAALGNLGNAYRHQGDARQAIGYYEQALEIDRQIGDRHGEGQDLGNLGTAYAALGDAQRAIGCYEQALAVARKIGERQQEGQCLGNLGIAYKNLGDPQKAIGYHEQALAIAREIGDRRGEGADLSNLGSAYALLGKTRRAVSYHEQALAIAREIGDRRGEGVALSNLGIAHRQLGDARRAIGYYEQALVIDREIGDRHGEGVDLGNLGLACAALGDARQAIGYYEQALAIRHEVGDPMGAATDQFNMALLYAQQGEGNRALPLAQEAARTFAQIGHAPMAQRAQQLVDLIRASLG